MTDPHNPDDYPPDVTTLDEMLAHDQRLQDARIARTLQEHAIERRKDTMNTALSDPTISRRNYSPALVRAVRAEAREVDFVCSTDSIDSYGTRLDQRSWNLKRFSANPAVLFAHQSRELPIGQAKNVRVEGGKLLATVWFSEAHERAREVFTLVREGTLRGISVGFDFGTVREEPNDTGSTVLVLGDLELIELSITPTPSNPDCIAKIRSRLASPITPVAAPVLPPAPITATTDEQDLAAFNDSLKSPEDREFDALVARCEREDREARDARAAAKVARPAAELRRNARGEIVDDEADLREFNASLTRESAAAESFFGEFR